MTKTEHNDQVHGAPRSDGRAESQPTEDSQSLLTPEEYADHRRSKGHKKWLTVGAVIGLSGTLAAGGVLVAGLRIMGRGAGAKVVALDKRVELESESPLPAPPLAIRLAGPVAGTAEVATACELSLAKMSMMAETLATDLKSMQTASAEAVVLPDQRRAGQTSQLPEYQRWEIRLPPGTTLESYARELDFFGIELGVIGGSPEIVYLSHFSQPKPTQRVASGRKDRRLYLTWERGSTTDQALAIRAGVEIKDKVIAQFYPPELEDTLATLERNYAAARELKTIDKTVFTIKPEGDGFAFYVMDQQGGKP